MFKIDSIFSAPKTTKDGVWLPKQSYKSNALAIFRFRNGNLKKRNKNFTVPEDVNKNHKILDGY